MDYILKSRGKGKTYDLIMRSHRTGERIICANGNSARYVNEKAKNMGVDIPEALPMLCLQDMSYDWANEKLLIDELSNVLQHVFGATVSAITDTPDSIIIDTVDLSDHPECYMKHYARKF